MAPLPDIRRIRTLQKVGVFRNYCHDAAVPDFKRYNLVYGFNGTGKTTVSRILRSLDGGGLASALPPGGRAELELSDGTVIASGQNADALARRVLVFNIDFINENLRWSEGRANPVFYIGIDASRRAELLERIERRIPLREEQRRRAQEDHSAKERALSTFLTDTARLIAEMLSLGRQYHAGHLKQDYESGAIAGYKALPDEERESRKTLIRQPDAYDKLDLPALDVQTLASALHQARLISETTISGVTLHEIQNHPSMVPWLKTGLDYHCGHNLESCLFCGSQITESRFEALQSALDEHFDRFFAEIERTAELLGKSRDTIQSFSHALPDDRAVTASLSRDYKEAASRFRTRLSDINARVDQAASTVAAKAASLNKSNWPDSLGDDRIIDAAVEALGNELQTLRQLIERHNHEQDEFGERQRRARNELKFAVLIEQGENYEALRRDVQAARKASEARERLHAKLVQRSSALRHEIRDHGPAVARINALLLAYLGHGEIRLEVFEDGYRILRHSRVMSAPLSEGERTAIALCYFLTKLEEEGRNLSQQIVVIDDPVSSLDAGSLNYAFNLLRGRLQSAQQLIVLTHNLAFMNETKKWLRKPREDGKASFFYLRTWHDKDQDRRQATIVEMPKLLRAYDSEYQYLFYLVKKCAEEGAESPNVPGYIMPNVIRRVLELFLAFKVPGSEGLGAKIDRPLVQNAGLGEARLQALNRLTQVESHSDSLDDFIALSAITVEETHRAALSVLRLTELLDNDHYTRMCEISN